MSELSPSEPLEPEVERVERPDGRYVLYFSWREADGAGEAPEEASPDE